MDNVVLLLCALALAGYVRRGGIVEYALVAAFVFVLTIWLARLGVDAWQALPKNLF